MKKYLVLLLPLLLLSDFALAQDSTTFASFYKYSGFFSNPWFWAAAGVIAVIGGAIIFFTGGTASPIVVWAGSSIGGAMGLSGAAAANAGLALLGGGSIASGGLGIAGGTALLTAVFTFSTGVVTDYAITTVANNYQYSNLVEQSKDMPTLPLPKNSNGSKQYKKAISILKTINKKEIISSHANKAIIKDAINAIKGNKTPKATTLNTLLYFISGDYQQAKYYAKMALNNTNKVNSLPSFIYAVSLLYDKDFNYALSFPYFEDAVLNEPDNRLIPMMLSIYLDRYILRFGFDDEFIGDIFNLIAQKEIKKFDVQNYTILLSRQFILLKQEQQKISILANTLNDKIKESPITLDTVKKSLNTYSNIIYSVSATISDYLFINPPSSSYWTRIKRYFSKPKISFIQIQDKYKTLLEEYKADETRLKWLVIELEKYQSYTTLLKTNFTSLEQENNRITNLINDNAELEIIKKSLAKYSDIINNSNIKLDDFTGQYFARIAEFKKKLKEYEQKHTKLVNKLPTKITQPVKPSDKPQTGYNNWVIYLISVLLLMIILYIFRDKILNVVHKFQQETDYHKK